MLCFGELVKRNRFSCGVIKNGTDGFSRRFSAIPCKVDERFGRRVKGGELFESFPTTKFDLVGQRFTVWLFGLDLIARVRVLGRAHSSPITRKGKDSRCVSFFVKSSRKGGRHVNTGDLG